MVYISKQYKLIESGKKDTKTDTFELYHPEDVVFQQHATESVVVSWKRNRSGDASCVFEEDGYALKEFRVLYVLPFSKFPSIVDALESFLNAQ